MAEQEGQKAIARLSPKEAESLLNNRELWAKPIDIAKNKIRESKKRIEEEEAIIKENLDIIYAIPVQYRRRNL